MSRQRRDRKKRSKVLLFNLEAQSMAAGMGPLMITYANQPPPNQAFGYGTAPVQQNMNTGYSAAPMQQNMNTGYSSAGFSGMNQF